MTVQPGEEPFTAPLSPRTAERVTDPVVAAVQAALLPAGSSSGAQHPHEQQLQICRCVIEFCPDAFIAGYWTWKQKQQEEAEQ